MEPSNGHSKMVAKIQHFYDLLSKQKEDYGATAITNSLDPEIADAIQQQYEWLSSQYKEIFKEFIYCQDTK